MKISRSVLFLVLPFVLAGGSGWSQGKDDTILKVLEVSGIKAQMDSIPQVVEGMFAQQSRAFDSEKYTKIHEILLRSFSSVNFLRFQSQELAENYSEQLCAKILNDYTSRVLLEATEAENSTLESISEEAVTDFDYSSVDSERDAVLMELITSTRSIEVAAALSAGGVHSLIATMNLFLPEKRKISGDQENAIIEQAAKSINSDQYLSRLKKKNALIYQEIPTEDLRTYVGFYQSPEGKYLYNSYVSALKKAFLNCMKIAAGEITKEFGFPDSKA